MGEKTRLYVCNPNHRQKDKSMEVDMTYLFFHMKKGEEFTSTEPVKAPNIWEANKKFKRLYQYSIIKSIRIKGGKL
jgi:hypothetical protein